MSGKLEWFWCREINKGRSDVCEDQRSVTGSSSLQTERKTKGFSSLRTFEEVLWRSAVHIQCQIQQTVLTLLISSTLYPMCWRTYGKNNLRIILTMWKSNLCRDLLQLYISFLH
ncbi:hypothetical protein NPIL_407141 [Nephila pilipes]|uniref:Uncharacterized protein n=1 Tax=Nephila pilipes TaxID=299642 RepID=A0A8X6TZT0_NEPPI|nr:hypothetical protein NPIL_407141 [Nephila pilipes]